MGQDVTMLNYFQESDCFEEGSVLPHLKTPEVGT